MKFKTIIIAMIALLIIPIGMEAKKKVKKEEVPQLLNYPSADWNEYRMHGGEMVIKGHVTADDSAKLKQLSNNVRIIMRDYIVRKEETIPSKSRKTAHFRSISTYLILCLYSSIRWQPCMPVLGTQSS